MKVFANSLNRFPSFAFVFLFGAVTAVAQTTVSTPIVGFEKVDLPANTYTAVGINLNNSAVISASVASVASNTVQLNGVTNASAGLDATQPYYLEVVSGAAAGTRLELDVAATVAAASSSVMINPSSANNTEALATVASSLPSASIQIKKHITINDIGNSITGLTAGPSGTGDEIHLLDPVSGGFKTYLRRTSTTWRDGNNNTVNSLPVAPGTGVILKKASVPGSITSTGAVRVNDFHLNLVPGYQLVTFGFPIGNSPTSLGAVGTSSTSPASGWAYGPTGTGDSIFALNNAGGFAQYILRTGNSWRDGNNTVVNTAEIMPAGGSYVIYKNSALNMELPKPTGL